MTEIVRVFFFFNFFSFIILAGAKETAGKKIKRKKRGQKPSMGEGKTRQAAR